MRNRDDGKEQLILQTALRLIMKTGLTGLKMSELAKEAGMATGTVYIYFDDKAALIQQLYAYLLRKSLSDLSAGIISTDPLRIKINKITRNYLNDCLKNPEYGVFFDQYFRSPYYIDSDEASVDEHIMLQPVYALILEGQQQTLIKEADPGLLVTLICGMLNELVKQTLLAGQTISETDWELTFRVIWDGVKR